MARVVWNTNTVVVFLGLALAVLPAAAMHVLTGIMLIVATPLLWPSGFKPLLWLAYIVGWWGLGALVRIFASFTRQDVRVGLGTLLGLVSGAVTVIVSVALPYTSLCTTCTRPEFLVYRPDVLSVAVAMHWSFLHFRGFRLTPRSSADALKRAA